MVSDSDYFLHLGAPISFNKCESAITETVETILWLAFLSSIP